ncbi:CinA family protein [Pseudomonas asplenii]|uniref:CinA family protein n=1 Tax=Pseudomonas asplenii TaxID=53407 RepID=UPI002234DE9B|nr:CinA family protein [Pseudomonas asplenii]UZE27200.1 CinA family protein [Pseudomonas asplenii]
MSTAGTTIAYLREHALRLTTAESCTAGMIVTLLSEIEGSGALIESGYVVYSPEAKQRLLRVSPRIIEAFGLTSCEVARDMALGALHDSTANVALATTGLLGPDDVDGIPAGTICFAWAFQTAQGQSVFTRRLRFIGSRCEVQRMAAEHALRSLADFHHRALVGERS